jgi:hypothetical protein
MSDEKPKPVDDLKQGLGLLFRAAKGVVEKIPTEKIEDAVKDGAKEVGKAVEAVANEIDKVFVKATSGSQPPQAGAQPPEPTTAEGVAQAKAQHDEDEKKKQEQAFDDAYAPEPPKGPRVG